MNLHRVGCRCCGGCELPATSDTLTISLRNSTSCLGCYNNNNGGGVSDINVNVDGDYTLTWLDDNGPSFSGLRRFWILDAAVTSGELRVWQNTNCTGGNGLLSNGLLLIIASFSIDTGCLKRIHTDLNQGGDGGSYSVFNAYEPTFSGNHFQLDTWLSNDTACGNSPPPDTTGCAIATGTEAKVVVD